MYSHRANQSSFTPYLPNAPSSAGKFLLSTKCLRVMLKLCSIFLVCLFVNYIWHELRKLLKEKFNFSLSPSFLHHILSGVIKPIAGGQSSEGSGWASSFKGYEVRAERSKSYEVYRSSQKGRRQRVVNVSQMYTVIALCRYPVLCACVLILLRYK